MNYGMQDAYNLGWKLASVLSSRSLPTILSSYHTERKKAGYFSYNFALFSFLSPLPPPNLHLSPSSHLFSFSFPFFLGEDLVHFTETQTKGLMNSAPLRANKTINSALTSVIRAAQVKWEGVKRKGGEKRRGEKKERKEGEKRRRHIYTIFCFNKCYSSCSGKIREKKEKRRREKKERKEGEKRRREKKEAHLYNILIIFIFIYLFFFPFVINRNLDLWI